MLQRVWNGSQNLAASPAARPEGTTVAERTVGPEAAWTAAALVAAKAEVTTAVGTEAMVGVRATGACTGEVMVASAVATEVPTAGEDGMGAVDADGDVGSRARCRGGGEGGYVQRAQRSSCEG